MSVGGIGGTRGGDGTMLVEGRVNKLGESSIRVASSRTSLAKAVGGGDVGSSGSSVMTPASDVIAQDDVGNDDVDPEILPMNMVCGCSEETPMKPCKGPRPVAGDADDGVEADAVPRNGAANACTSGRARCCPLLQ